MNILIVDDDDDLRELLTAMLEGEEEFPIQTARHGREALERVSEHMPDIILLDMKMPVMDGWTFAREFERRYGRSVPIVVMTAAEHAAQRVQEMGRRSVALETLSVRPAHQDSTVSTSRVRGRRT